ncbi:MAG: aminodeoxychorismate/anthranilate synthase component II [Candidatus Neomarinimicrobiota bacterium]
MILVVDNYDSFTYNLVHFIGRTTTDIKVVRNDALSVEEVAALAPAGIVISPGPGRPENAGISIPLVQRWGAEIPILGICLGHQAIAAAFGGRIARAPEIVHGKVSSINHDGDPLFDGIDSPFQATRYHSLVLDDTTVPPELTVIARTNNGLVMGVRHHSFPIVGLQFHPESIVTDNGPQIIANFIEGTK